MGNPSMRPGYTVLSDSSVEFVVHRPDAQQVEVVGDFTDWALHPLPMRRGGQDGSWVVRTPPLSKGAHFYKYRVDGRWEADSAHPMGAPDGFGGRNSAFGVGPDPVPPQGFRFASLNLYTYQEADPLLKLEQVAYGLSALGVQAVALQEVGEHLHDPSKGNAGEVIRGHLERQTGQHWDHQWRMAHIGFNVYREGISLLASVPLQDVQEFRLSHKDLARNALAGTIRVEGVSIRLCSTHVTWPKEGDDEVQGLIRALATPPPGVVATLIGGDFNAVASDPQVQRILEAGYQDVACVAGSDLPTIGVHNEDLGPPSRIDYHFLKVVAGSAPLAVRACARIFIRNAVGTVYLPRVSDHAGLLGVFGTL
ncbi:MAG: endonuclease/exonuclease/phosphatase family protein [Isosphaeraceae bacterium]